MFFRVVTTRYKNKEYSYLKLLETYRSGNKTKQRVLMNIANLDRIPQKMVTELIEELHESLEFCKSLRAFSTTGARFAKLSYIFAVERIFRQSNGCSNSEVREIFLNEKNKARYYNSVREQFYNLIHKKVITTDGAREGLFWSKKLNIILNSADDNLFLGVLLNASGFPLRYVIFRQYPGPNPISQILAEINEIYNFSRITALICEDTYHCFINGQLMNEDANGITPEVFLHRQATNWLGQTSFATDRYFLLNRMQHGNEETPQIIKLINEFAEYLNWSVERALNVLTDNTLSTTDILDITLISCLLYKMIDLILKKNNLTLAGNKTKFFQQIPNRPIYI